MAAYRQQTACGPCQMKQDGCGALVIFPDGRERVSPVASDMYMFKPQLSVSNVKAILCLDRGRRHGGPVDFELHPTRPTFPTHKLAPITGGRFGARRERAARGWERPSDHVPLMVELEI